MDEYLKVPEYNRQAAEFYISELRKKNTSEQRDYFNRTLAHWATRENSMEGLLK